MARHGLSEKEWLAVRGRWPQRRGPRSEDADRRFVEAVVWIARTGAPWRDLEPSFGPWQRTYNRFRRWARRGWWLDLFRGAKIEEVVGSILDATIVRAHQDSSGGKNGAEANAIGRSRGGCSTKLHAVVTVGAKPIEIVATVGQPHEATIAEQLLDFVHGRACLADRGYDADRIIDAARERDLEPVIPPSKARTKRRRYDRSLYKLRYRVEVFFHSLKRNRRIATRYDKTIVCFMGFVHVICFLLSL